MEYYNSGTEDGYKKFVPSKKKKRDGESSFSCIGIDCDEPSNIKISTKNVTF